MYLAGSRFGDAERWGPPQTIIKARVEPKAGLGAPATAQEEVWYPGRDVFVQEPNFVPRPGGQAEDDGWVLALVHDAAAATTSLAILDAQRLSAGPICTVRLPFALPPGLHGSWTRSFLGPDPAAPFQPRHYDVSRGAAAYE